jgi:hypothetical protein
MTPHRNPAPVDHPAPRSSWHPNAAAVLDTILLIAAVMAVVAVAIVASSSITGLEPGTLPSPTPVGY